MPEITFRQCCGYVFCLAGILLGCAAWLSWLTWEWGILALLLIVLGWILLRRRKGGDWGDDIGDLVDDGIDWSD